MTKEKYIDDYIKEGDDVGAIRFLSKELYTSFKIGGTRKYLLDRVADKLERDASNMNWLSNTCAELSDEVKQLKSENQRLLAKNNSLIDKYSKKSGTRRDKQ